MIIPITKGQATAPGAPAQGMPSETNLMMALATMHEQGRFQVAGTSEADANKKPQYFEDTIHSQTDLSRKGADQSEKEYDDKLEQWRGKAKEGDFLILRDEKGNEFYHRRNNDFEPGWEWWPKPEATS